MNTELVTFTERVARLEAENARLREVLVECKAAMSLLAEPAISDPVTMPLVQQLGEVIGYGNMMATASALWRANLAKYGIPPGGEFSCNICVSTAKALVTEISAALNDKGGGA